MTWPQSKGIVYTISLFYNIYVHATVSLLLACYIFGVAGTHLLKATCERELVMAGIPPLNATCKQKVMAAGKLSKQDTRMSGGSEAGTLNLGRDVVVKKIFTWVYRIRVIIGIYSIWPVTCTPPLTCTVAIFSTPAQWTVKIMVTPCQYILFAFMNHPRSR